MPWLALCCGRLPSAHSAEGTGTCSCRVLISLQWAWRGNQVDDLFIFLFFQDSFWPAYLPKLSCWWTCLCKKATGASWNTDFALMRNHIFGCVSLTLRRESARAENLCGPGWNQNCLSRRNAEKSQDLGTWSQMLVSGCSLYSFGHAAPRRSGARRCQPALPATSPPHLPPAQARGVTQTSLTDYNLNKLYANRLGQSQVIKLPVTGSI